MAYTPAVLAVVFDFDDTLVPDSTTKFLRAHGIDPNRFWTQDAAALVADGYDPPLAYLKLMLDLIGPDKALGELTEAALTEFGASLDNDYYPGLPALFTELRDLVHAYQDIAIEFYIISGGLEAVIQGSKTVRDNFTAWYGCRFGENLDTGVVKYIQRCITFTEKTRYLFEINKGIGKDQSSKNPYLVNKDLPQGDRRIAFRNMIYVGDGLTDIPCFSLLQNLGGVAFGVFQPEKQTSAKRAFLEFLKPKRVVGVHAPKYRPEDELGSLLRAAVSARCGQIVVERERA